MFITDRGERKAIVTAVLGVFLALAIAGQAEAQKKRTKTTAKPAPAAKQPEPRNALERGYLGGYGDGYVSGRTDYNTNTPKDFQRSTLYQEANRGYETSYGEVTEFQRGYRPGYEIGYNDGYTGRDKNTSLPSNLVALTTPQETAPVMTPARPTEPSARAPRPRPSNVQRVIIAPDQSFRLRLEDRISTKTNQSGDRFTATIVEPREYEGLTIEGHIADLKRSGKLTGQTKLSLEFDSIVTRDGSRSPFHAQLERVYATEKVKTVDEEGNVQTGSTTRDTTVRTAGGAAIGAIIGGIAGGGKGAAIGAILGATVGAGSVYVQGNKDLIFEAGTEIQVKTIGPQR